MASYFDDHNVSNSRLQNSNNRQNVPESLDFSHFTSLTSPVNSSENANNAVPSNVLAVVSLLDSFRLNAHSTAHQSLLEQLISELINGAATRSGPPPASQVFIDALPHTVDPKDCACSICTEPYKVTSDIRYLPCGHTFDKDCIVPWLELRNTCPMCRVKLPTDIAEEDDKDDSRSNFMHPLQQHTEDEDNDPFALYLPLIDKYDLKIDQ